MAVPVQPAVGRTPVRRDEVTSVAGDATQKAAWVRRVLGIEVAVRDQPEGVAVTRQPGDVAGPLLPIWLDAKEAVDAGLSQLQQVLSRSDRPGLRLIAEYGLNGVTQRETVGMMVALRGFDADPGSQRARAGMISAVEAFRSVLDQSPIVALLEDNPFGVAVPMRGTLGKALDTITGRIGS